VVPALSVREAVNHAATADVWLFRGPTPADRAIRIVTNAPVNHVAMVVALEDLPPLLWHTGIGRSLESVWTGERHRGAQLNVLTEAIDVWTAKYHQRAWVRHFDGEVTRDMEDALLCVIGEFEGRPFPRTRHLVGKCCRADCGGRHRSRPSTARNSSRSPLHMGLLDARRHANWFDPGRFWSGALLLTPWSMARSEWGAPRPALPILVSDR
jgi:hypothetical protein